MKTLLHSTDDASRLDCVARRSHIGNMLPPRALPDGRLPGLGATRGFTADSQEPAEPDRKRLSFPRARQRAYEADIVRPHVRPVHDSQGSRGPGSCGTRGLM